jgi:hypothetical protein
MSISRKIRWMGGVTRMGGMKINKNSCRKDGRKETTFGRPRSGWKDIIKMDLK